MMSSIKAHLQAIKVALASRMAYRGDYFISFFIMLVVELFAPVITLLIYGNGASFPGWSLYEALLIQGIFLLSRGIAFPFFFGMVWNTLGQVQGGTLDLLFLRPRSLLHMVIMTGFDSEDLGKLLGGLLLFLIALFNLPAPGAAQWLQFLLVFLFSLIMLFAFALIMASLVIVWVGNGRVYEIYFAVTAFGQYPLAIFSKPVQTFITMIIPVSLLGFFPANILLGRPSPGVFLAMGFSLLFLFFSLWLWKRMVYHYNSAGG